MGIVVDASVTLSWCFPDEQTPLSLKVLDRLNGGEEALVPAFWSVEVLNSLFVGERRGRIRPEETRDFLDQLAGLGPTIDYAPLVEVFGTLQMLCRQYGLTPYDALYVELAQRTRWPLATLDQSQLDSLAAPSWRPAR
jgi:predicted nucleic acid-binding protein